MFIMAKNAIKRIEGKKSQEIKSPSPHFFGKYFFTWTFSKRFLWCFCTLLAEKRTKMPWGGKAHKKAPYLI
jgi:hypothetical protein